jgi:serine/threonine protein kinase
MATINTNSAEIDRDPIEVMAESFLERYRRGERPSIEEYAAKYPELANEVRELLPALVQLERDLSVADGTTGSHRAAPPAATLRGAPRQLGDYTILREVGRGGMGVVYEAVQQSLGRHVALKVLSWQAVGDSSHLERFRLEARSAARLHHTNIVPVFGVGESEGVHYYAMQFIHGQGLDAVIDELRQLRNWGPESEGKAKSSTIAATVARELLGNPPAVEVASIAAETFVQQDGTGEVQTADREVRGVDRSSSLTSHSELTGAHDRRFYRQVARLALQVAEGLAYAHGQGVLHRDIKPSNLLVDTRGTVWITDFGLAKAEGSDGPTRTGDVVGTLRYLAPERFEGRSDRRSDVYSLGATLYELLTLQPLFGDIHRAKLVDKVLHEPPPSPRRLDRRIPRDLETIVLKALAKEPAHRYSDAESMAADLRRFIDDRPILTRRASTTEQIWRWCRRNPAVASLISLLLLLMIGGTIAAGQAAHHFRRLALAEGEARTRADALAHAELQAHALAKRRAEEAQAARAEADAKAREAQAVADFLVMDLIGAAAPGKGQGTSMTVGEALARADATIDKRFAGQPLLAATIHFRMGATYWNLSQYQQAELHYRTAADLRAQHLGPDARDTLLTRQKQINALRELGDRDAARRLAEELLERLNRALGPDDPDALLLRSEMGLSLFPFSDARALEYYRGLHESLARVIGAEDPVTLNALQYYGESLAGRGEHDRAEVLFRQALELHVKTIGEVDKTTFWTMNELVREVLLAGKFDQALKDVERLWPPMARNLNPGDPELQLMNRNVTSLVQIRKDVSRPVAMARRVTNEVAADLGQDHIRTLGVRALLAYCLACGDRRDEAVAIANEVVKNALDREANGDREDVLTRAAAAIDRARGNRSGSEETIRKLLDRADRQKASGKTIEAANSILLAMQINPDDARIHQVLKNLDAGALDHLGQQPGLTPSFRNGLAWNLVTGSNGSPDHRIVAQAVRMAELAVKADSQNFSFRNTYGAALYRAGELDRAIAELEKSNQQAEPIFYMLFNDPFLAMAYWRRGDRPKGLAHLDRCTFLMDAWMAPADMVRIRAEAESLIDSHQRRPHFRTILGDLPAYVYNARAWALAARGEWSAALADLHHAGEIKQPVQSYGNQAYRSIVELGLAALTLEMGDDRAYRQRCRAMLDALEKYADAVSLERTVKACLLVAPASLEELRRLRQHARHAVDICSAGDPGPCAWSLLCLGLAEYRAGGHEAAIQLLDRCLKRKPSAPEKDIDALSVQAMALYRVGRTDAAREHLDRAERQLSKHVTSMTGSNWPSRLIARRLLREAQAIVRFDPIFPAAPFSP